MVLAVANIASSVDDCIISFVIKTVMPNFESTYHKYASIPYTPA